MMLPDKPPTAEEFRLARRFEDLRKTLRAERYAQHIEKPLAFWTVPSDRRLPSVFLSRTLKELLDTPLAELAATPGVGRKKMRWLVELLSRAADTTPEDLAPATTLSARSGNGGGADGSSRGQRAARLNPDHVSEVIWGKWQASVIALGLEKEPLGRLTSSLRDLPCAGWNTPLGRYTRHTLAEIRGMKTHGRKRVRAILEAFESIHQIAARAETTDRSAMQLCPGRISDVQQWTRQTLHAGVAPSRDVLLEHFIRPLLEQLEIDAPRQAIRLAHCRLGIDGPIASAGEAARRMGLTRARVYQLLNIVNDILMLRWPGGRRLTHDLCDHLANLAESEATLAQLDQFFAAVELFYPRNRRLAMIAAGRREGRRGDGI